MSDPTIAWIVAGVAFVLFVLCYIYYRKSKREADELWTVDLYGTTELKRMCSDGFNATVQVEGNVACDNPLVSIAAQRTCCYFTTTVEREDRQTRTVESTDAEGHKSSREEVTLTWHTDFSRTNSVPFTLSDTQGSCEVQPQKSDIDLESVYSDTMYGRLNWFDDVGVRWSNTNRYRVTENVFAPEGYAFVHGRASAANGGVTIGYPETGYVDPRQKVFIISRSNKQSLVKSRQKNASLCFWGAMLFGVVTLVAVLYAFGGASVA